MKHTLLILVVSVMLTGLLAAPRPAQAATTITACGTITTDVILGANLRAATGDCLTIGANNITIDGNGKTITVSSNSRVASLMNRSGVTFKNLRSKAGIQIYGEAANDNRIENSTLGGVAVYMGDNTTITGNHLTSVAIQGLYNNPATRATITDNVVKSSANRLVDIVTGGDGTRLCVEGYHLIARNQLINTAKTMDPDAPITLYYRCSKSSTIADNYLRATGIAQGIRMRDEADGNTVTGNTVITNTSDRGALMLSSGNVDKGFSSNNVFSDNTFRGLQSRSLFVQAQGANNRYERNLFWSGAYEGAFVNVGPSTVFDHNTFVGTSTASKSRGITWDNHDTGSLQFTNNIVMQPSPAGYLYGFDGFTTSVYRGDYNLFWQAPSGLLFGSFGNLTGWQNSSGDDGASQLADPKIRSIRQGDLTLQATSPARGSASDGSDLGAYQFSGGYCGSNWIRSRFNPAPQISSLTPSSLSASTAMTITITGRNFRRGTKVYLGKTRLATTLVSSSSLSVTIPANRPVGTYDLIVRSRGTCVKPQSVTIVP